MQALPDIGLIRLTTAVLMLSRKPVMAYTGINSWHGTSFECTL